MTLSRCLMGLLLLVPGMLFAAGQPVPSSFRYNRTVPGPLSPGTVYRIMLPGDVLHHARPDHGDIRLFTPEGDPVPAVVLSLSAPSQSVTLTNYHPISFREIDGVIRIELETDREPEAPITEMILETPDRDFEATVIIRTEDDAEPVARGTIFDYTSRVQLRRTSVSMRPTRATRLILEIKPRPADSQTGTEPMELTYRDLTFRTGPPSGTPLTFTAFLGRATGLIDPDMTAKPVCFELTDLVRTNRDGQSLLQFRTGIPATSIGIVTDTPYFYRDAQVSLQQPGSGRPDRVIDTGTLYRFPTAAGTAQQLELPVHGPLEGLVTLAILNRDNPPLRIRTIRLSAPPMALFFIPDRTLSYVILGYGRPDLTPVSQDIQHIIRADNWRDMSATDLAPGPVRVNRIEITSPVDNNRMNRTLMIVVLAVAILLALWTRRLLQETRR